MTHRRQLVWIAAAAIVVIAVSVVAAVVLLRGGDAAAGLRALNERLGPRATLEWQSAQRDFSGTLRATGVTIRTARFHTPLRIAELRLSTGGDGALAALLQRLADGRMPESLRITAQGLQLPLRSDLHRALERHVRLWGTPLDGLACGDNGWLHAAVLEADGRSALDASLDLSLRVRPPAQQAGIVAHLDIPGVAAAMLDTNLDLASLQLRDTWARSYAELQPALSNLRLRLTDQGFNAKRNHYCAKRLGIDVTRFLDRHMAAVQELYGAREDTPALPPAAVKAYRRYADSGGGLRIDAAPLNRVPLRALLHEDRAALLRRIDVRLQIDGRGIAAPKKAWLPPLPLAPLGGG